jgi:hypothetical protein
MSDANGLTPADFLERAVDWTTSFDVFLVAREECRRAGGVEGFDLRGRDVMLATAFVLLKRAFPDCDQEALRLVLHTRLDGEDEDRAALERLLGDVDLGES